VSAPAVGAVHGTLLYAGGRLLDTRHGGFTLHGFQNLATRATVLVAAAGDLAGAAPVLARVHSSCVTSEAYGSCDCDCATQLDAAFARIAAAGRGVVVYLMQEGRGAGFSAKVRDRMLVQASGGRMTTFDAYAQMGLGDDHRTYDEVVQVRALLGVAAPFTLLTNNPEKLRALEAAGVPVAGAAPLRSEASPFAAAYLRAKRRAGHRLGRVDDAGAASALPEPVVAFAPARVPELDGIVRLASYLLPLGPWVAGAGEGPVWLRVHAYFDLAAGCERVILEHRAPPGAPPHDSSHELPLIRVQRERLVDRLPLRCPSPDRRHWQASVRAFVRHGAGIAAVLSDDARAALGDETTAGGDEGGASERDAGPPPSRQLPARVAALIARHLAGRQGRLLVAADEASGEGALSAALARGGAHLAPSCRLDDAG